jgi:hypothetical protein
MKYFKVRIVLENTYFVQAEDEREARVKAFSQADPEKKYSVRDVEVKEEGTLV